MREVTGFTATYRHIISVEEGGEEGDCLHIRPGYHHAIQGFPSCVVADAVINFFMGRTNKVQQVGFNPRLARRGHLGESGRNRLLSFSLKYFYNKCTVDQKCCHSVYSGLLMVCTCNIYCWSVYPCLKHIFLSILQSSSLMHWAPSTLAPVVTSL